MTLCHLESSQHHSTKNSGGKKTESYSTEKVDSSDRSCKVPGCSTKHQNKSGQNVNTLALCNDFKGLSMKDKLGLMKSGKCCYTFTKVVNGDFY